MKHQEFKHVILLRCMSQLLALFGHGAMSDLSPLCAPKRTFANAFGFMGSRPTH
jgi:hypothetical protein